MMSRRYHDFSFIHVASWLSRDLQGLVAYYKEVKRLLQSKSVSLIFTTCQTRGLVSPSSITGLSYDILSYIASSFQIILRSTPSSILSHLDFDQTEAFIKTSAKTRKVTLTSSLSIQHLMLRADVPFLEMIPPVLSLKETLYSP
jgi:hypothetical protein